MPPLRPFRPADGGPATGDWLFVDDDPNNLYRALPSDHIGALAVAREEDFFIPYEATGDKLGGHDVIRVRKLPFQVRIQELTRRQAMECVKFLVDFAIHCHENHELTPSDIHEGNLLWWNRPWFVDYDALKVLDARWAAHTFVRIGYLLYKYVFRQVTVDHDHFDIGVMAQLGWAGDWVAEQAALGGDFTDPLRWRRFRDVLDEMAVPEAPASHWSTEYAIAQLPDLGANPKFAALSELAPAGRTMLDVGCNRGYTGRLLRDRYECILGFDADEDCVNKAYREPEVNVACFGIDHLFVDWPTHPIIGRYQADVVMALALTHHLATAEVPVTETARVLAALTRKHLLIEDIADVASYDKLLGAAGLEQVRRVPSHPGGRTLTLWVRP